MSLPGKGRIGILAVLFLGLMSLKGVGHEPPQKGERGQQGGGEGKTSVGLKPLTEMTAEDKYKGEDGLVWVRRDFVADGTRPENPGQKKVADMLLKFLKTDADARTWFVKSQPGDQSLRGPVLRPSQRFAAPHDRFFVHR